jgi:hypothetical protein
MSGGPSRFTTIPSTVGGGPIEPFGNYERSASDAPRRPSDNPEQGDEEGDAPPDPITTATNTDSDGKPLPLLGERPELFKGESAKAKQWIRLAENYFLLNHTRFSSNSLKVRTALTWMDTTNVRVDAWVTLQFLDLDQLTEEGKARTWASFKNRFIEQWVEPRDKQQAIQELRELRQKGATVNEHLVQFETLIARAQIDDDEIKSAFLMESIRPELGAKLAAVGGMASNSYRELIGIARQVELAEKQQRIFREQYFAGLPRRSFPQNRPPERSNNPRPQVRRITLTNDQYLERKRKGACFNCGSESHRSRECNQPRVVLPDIHYNRGPTPNPQRPNQNRPNPRPRVQMVEVPDEDDIHEEATINRLSAEDAEVMAQMAAMGF